ncbi:MAG: DUF4038 domain-containing protein [Clostridia bacterium]|nr:DUF4038 domain-containing protein [Clostridia bacterium]
MKRNLIQILSFLLGMSFVIPCMLPYAHAAGSSTSGGEPDVDADGSAGTVEVWKRTDIVLKSAKTYKNPYKDVDIDAEFVHEDGTRIHLYGFWYGGSEWHVRFAPTKAGVWTYTVTSTDADNPDLNGVTGTVSAVDNTGATDIDRHGFVRVSDNGRYFVHDDGTPFYWLGDTNWQAPNYVSITQCNYPGCGCGNQFRHEVDDRAAKGFTVYQTYFDSAESDGGGQRAVTKEPGLWRLKYSRPNTDTFAKKIDAMFDYLAEKGMVIALGFGVHSSTTGAMSEADLNRFSRYLTARYAAYPVVWITAQEITGEAQFDRWVSSARIVAGGDGYCHPQGAHQYPLPVDNEFVAKLDAESWHGFYALQSGHGAIIQTKKLYEGYWNNTRAGAHKPFVETEANYEDIICGGFNGYDASRISAWKANLCGSYGFTYGVTGVWANNYSTAGNTGWLGTFSFEPWYMGIDKPGSFEMKYMAEFFKSVDFSRLVPRFDDGAYSDFTEETKVVASSDNADTYVAYFYNPSYDTGELRGLNPKINYSARWFDPLTGKYVEIPGRFKAKNGNYSIPRKPTAGDWVLLVTGRVFGNYMTEKAYTDSILSGLDGSEPDAITSATRRGDNILSGVKAGASSRSGDASAAAMSVDGSPDTWWCASGPELPQSLWFELPEARDFNTFSLNMYRGTSVIGCVLEGSDDGQAWREIIRCEDLPADYTGAKSLFTLRLGSEYSYRHLRVTFTKVVGNWAAVIEAAAWLARDQGALPEYGGELQFPDVKCTGSYIYDAAGNASDTVGALFDGNDATLWRPYAPIGTQTILMDLRELHGLTGINIRVGQNALIPRYRIEGSKDGSDWTVIADAGLRGPNTVYDGDRRVVSEALSGNYRYVKLLWLNLGSNTADKSIAEIELYAGAPGPEEDNTPASSRFPWKAVLIPGLAVLAAGGAAALLIRKRGKKRT